MVVLAAAVVTKGGKPVIARVFKDLPRARIESLLSTFPKLVPPSSQHTVIDDPASAIRYVYQPLEDLWLVVLTNRQSNILQDIDTLHLLSRIVSDFCRGSVTESEVLSRSFEVLSSFDEVVSLGYREKVDLNGIRSVMEMESHEEKIQDIIAKNKEQEAKEELKRRAKQLDMQRRDAAKRGQADVYAAGMQGSGGGGYDRPYQPTPVPPTIRDDPYRLRADIQRFSSRPSAPAAKPFKTKGMQLGSKGKSGHGQGGLLDALGDDYVAPEPQLAAVNTSSHSGLPSPTPAPQSATTKADVNPFAPDHQEDVHLVIREKLSAELARDGGVAANASMVLSGSLDLKVGTASASKIWLKVQSAVNKGLLSAGDLQFKTHPNVDKKAWAENQVIKLKDPARGFPVGQGLGVLKWRLMTKDETLIPVSINCWPTQNDDGSCDVNIEYEAENDHIQLHNLVITLQLPEGSAPNVTQCDGTWKLQTDDGTWALQWSIAPDESGVAPSTGTMEFNCPRAETDSFFPVTVDFISEKGLCQVSVDEVSNIEGDEAVEFSTDSLLNTDEYFVA
ncbi:uncharacterized protein MELLADRAFT_116836 [Melampsora larici-populina 98AG31]|uniref:Coatomer subunit delta n=1 Tax=Melampsora larici-populina (strain 98AG31 / pathotype 3-4-7) TaxID=747676 RepID=F4RQC0_MELLP|nr:uncharacterized protein MELLADRAFT_116836 [Melampsora larici-populina 98AG31]EGG05432.1 hypothetical protein MELLADRAFT_116836 [Melampsora larici-populina 98AG31]